MNELKKLILEKKFDNMLLTEKHYSWELFPLIYQWSVLIIFKKYFSELY